MKVVYKSEIPIQQCFLCKSKVEIKHKDIKKDCLTLRLPVWKCPLCKEIQSVKWGEPNET